MRFCQYPLYYAALGLAAALLSAISGCTSPETPKTPQTKINDIGSRVEDPFLTLPPTPPPESFFTVTIQRLEFLPQTDVEPGWTLTTTDGLDAQQLELWQLNGLRTGLLDQAQARDFYSAFRPGAVLDQTRKISNAGELNTYQTSAPIIGTVPLRLLSSPDQVEAVLLSGGRCQFLTQFRLNAGLLNIELVPHHYQPMVSLVPRSLEQKELDGQIFRKLALQAALPPGKILVVGPRIQVIDSDTSATQPWAVNAGGTSTVAAGVLPSSSTPSSMPPATQPALPRRVIVPDLLGARILTTSHQRTQTQILLLIGIAPETSIPESTGR